jgi:hypothetical protein
MNDKSARKIEPNTNTLKRKKLKSLYSLWLCAILNRAKWRQQFKDFYLDFSMTHLEIVHLY